MRKEREKKKRAVKRTESIEPISLQCLIRTTKAKPSCPVVLVTLLCSQYHVFFPSFSFCCDEMRHWIAFELALI